MERNDLCKLCLETFGDSIRPRVLPCGHSYCTDCLDKLIENGSLSCPKCKRNHRVSDERYFPINYDLEESLSEAQILRALLLTKAQPSSKIPKMETLISEQKSGMHIIILAAEKIKSQLKGYDEFILTKKKKHGEVLQKIRVLANLHEVLVKETEEERHKIVDLLEEGNRYSMEVNDKLPSLDNAMSNRAATAALTDVLESVVKLECWIERCQQEFPFPKITFSQQVLMKSMESLSSVVFTKEEEVLVASCLTDDDLTITEKVSRLGNNPKVTLDRLRSTPQYWRKQIAAGQVYAVQSYAAGSRSTILTEENGRIYMYQLQDQETPPFAYIIEHNELVETLDEDATVTFMDLAWECSSIGRVHILLSPDTPLAQHFRILCTGDLGPSYAHSKFYEVCYRNEARECLRGGDYEYNNGTGGAPVMRGLFKDDDAIYIHNWETGIVYMTPDATGRQLAQFSIRIGSGKTERCHCVFGKVQDGLDVLRDVAKSRNLKQVEIIDCGVVLPL